MIKQGASKSFFLNVYTYLKEIGSNTHLLVHENGSPGRAPVEQDSAYNLIERSMFLCHSYDECMQELRDNRDFAFCPLS